MPRRLLPFVLLTLFVLVPMMGMTARAAGAATISMGADVDVPLGAPVGKACQDTVTDLNARGWVVFADGQPIAGTYPSFDCTADNRVVGHASTSIAGSGADAEKRRQGWRTALDGLTMGQSYDVRLGFGPPGGSLTTPTLLVTLELGSDKTLPMALGALAVVLGLAVIAVWLGFTRDPMPDIDERVPLPEALRATFRGTFSLSRTQLLVWSAVLLWSFLALLLITGAMPTITTGAMALMGIVGGTSLLSVFHGNRTSADDTRREQHIVEYQKLATARQAADITKAQADALDAEMLRVRNHIYPQSKSLTAGFVKGFFDDLLTDADGFNVHRLQLLTWTAVLALAFVYEVLRTLGVPELSTNLLALTGISNGTYFGFKVQEQQVPDSQPTSNPAAAEAVAASMAASAPVPPLTAEAPAPAPAG